ncbi:uncharacterized protein LOC129960380 [Argiope bruennichi]|uniref:uncharacterized protein LOC129960380 n=1 Tax=Argiope bruennichi TaxID=94029 RepID=UPI002494F118|nr:uncharacterized protein LOC129960380 [Argiope bruennichi]
MLQLPPPLLDSGQVSCPPWSSSRSLGFGCGTAVLNGVVGGGGGLIRPDRSSRTNVQKLTWRNSPWIRGYSHSDSKISSMTIADVSPTVAMKRVILLYENQQYREAANFVNRLHRSTFKAILDDLPIDMFVEAMPQSLPILEALYAKVFLSDGLNFPMRLLRPESVIMQMAKMFSHRDVFESMMNGQNPFILSCKKLIKVIVVSEPRLKKQMIGRKRALEKAVEGMGQHGLVGTSDKTLMNLHEALKVEFERAIHQYKIAVQKLDELCLTPKQLVTRSLSYGPAPTKASHQRQLSLRQDEIQERLIKNKSLLNVIEPTLTDHSLELLLKILQKRVEIDKDIIFQFTQLKKEVKDIKPDAVVAPILMKFSKGCSRVLELMKELGDEGDDDASSSDISGYHSDSDSAIANGSLQSRGCRRYNLMYRSVRVNSRSSSSGCSPDTYSSEGSKSSRNKQKPVLRNGANRLFSVSPDSKQACSITVHVPDGTQSIVSTDSNSSIWKIAALNKEIESLRSELDRAKSTITNLQDSEQRLKCRLAEQAQKMLERGAKFENVCLGEKRPTALVRQYGNLYAQARVDTLDALDALPPLQNADELKSKILFSVIVLSFRSVQNTLSDIKDQIYSILQVRDARENSIAFKELETGIANYLRKTAESFNLSKNVSEVCSQIQATLYDYPCLKNCSGLLNYSKDCVRLAWFLTNQNPPYVIDYETRTFRKDMHMRFHTSNQASNIIKSYLWPTLMEGENGPCVHRGVVLT